MITVRSSVKFAGADCLGGFINLGILSEKLIKRSIIVISICVLICSFTQHSYCTTNGCRDSFFIYIFGAIGFVYSWAGLTWLANPLLFISWVTFDRYRKMSLITSLLATVIALSFMLCNKIIDNEGGYFSAIVSYRPGYWLWVSSSLVMLLGNVIMKQIIQ
jgi:hypothetical protein